MKTLSVTLLSIFLISLITAQTHSIDISGLKSEDYSIGEDLNIKVILLENEEYISQDVELTLSDALEKKVITKNIKSNTDTTIQIGNDFPSGLWNVKATYQETGVERTFSIGESSSVEFLIEEDELIIRNTGNVRYTKIVQIKIGSETNSYTQNIRVGNEKRLKLISPKGQYNIEVTDGTTSIKRENVQLFGTGNVIGAVDEDLIGYTGFAGAGDPSKMDDQFFSTSKLPVALVFIAAVFGLAVLMAIQKRVTKKKSKKKK